jgi:hypothetical protein
MLPPIQYLLLCLQNELGNVVTPKLRAVTIDINEKKHQILPCFIYDGEVTEEIQDLYSVALVEVDTNTKEDYIFCNDYILSLPSPKEIPIRGKLAYLRYEPVLPKITRENRSFLLKENTLHHAIYRLDMQEALLGKVTPALRHVGIDALSDQKKLIAHFIYDGEISERDHNLAAAAIEESRISFPDFQMESKIERVDAPNSFSSLGSWMAYFRREFIY